MKMVWFRSLILLGITGYCSLSIAMGAVFDDQSQRMSLAISGGASKGAYEAGINWGVLKILTNFSGSDPILGGEYRPFEAVSFAGASAGGINSILSGITWCARPEKEGGLANSIENNLFRDVWLNLDVNRLLPATAASGYYDSDDALLSRNDLRTASELLKKSWHTPAFQEGCQVSLGVTVTRVEPEVLYIGKIKVQNQRFYIPFELYVKQDRTAGFRFNPDDYPTLLDAARLILPTQSGSEPNTFTDHQVETISFASSAFPLAFSRQRLPYCRLSTDQKYAAEDKKAASYPQDSDQSLQCPQGYTLVEAEFADGGLFDNLPVGLARILAEQNRRSRNNPLPITYLYIDPDRLRYEVPESMKLRACGNLNPPAACNQLEYSFLSESGLLVGALGTARRYELYRELTSDYWTNNLSELGYTLADKLKESRPGYRCHKYLPFFDKPMNCHEAVRRAGRFLELAYDRILAPITSPLSVTLLRQENIVTQCRQPKAIPGLRVQAECKIDILRYRTRYANALTSIMQEIDFDDAELYRRIQSSRLSPQSDRIIRVSSLGSPITGDLLGNFGGFLDRKFREYDYYVGIYDVVVAATNLICTNHFSPGDQGKAYTDCFNAVGKYVYETIGLNNDQRGRYIFALLARKEFGMEHKLNFSYEPMPPEDEDMHIVHDGLVKTLEAGLINPNEKKSAFDVEKVFFEYLKQ